MTDSTLPRVTPTQVRDEFVDMLTRDWLGPAGGEDEVLYERSVRDRYLVGMLAPNHKLVTNDRTSGEDEEEPSGFNTPILELGELAPDGMDSGDDGTTAPPIPDVGDTAAFIPSSLGLTVLVSSSAPSIIVEVRYGRYENHKNEASERSYWQRIPVRFVSNPIPLRDGLISTIPTERGRGIHLIGLCRKTDEGCSLTLFLVNGQGEPKRFKDQAWVFQPEIHLYAPDGSPIFTKRALSRTVYDEEDRTTEMLYRERQEFAIGHGVGVTVNVAPDDPSCAVRIATRLMPSYEVAPMQARSIPSLMTDMKMLSQIPQGGFTAALSPLIHAYAEWLNERAVEMEHPDVLLRPYVHDGTSAEQLRKGHIALQRIQAGIELLDADANAAHAFRFANEAMALQRVRTLFSEEARRGIKPDMNKLDVPKHRSWRPFQLAFILLNLPAMVNPAHPERSDVVEEASSIADLLWFPTGGGKTEAYLGLTAFTLAIRRLRHDLGGFDGHGAGVAVIMRYTLRLLTLQQFQRATALIAACEVLRSQASHLWGEERFRIGLWVGARSTPNYTEDSATIVAQAHGKGQWRGGGNGTPMQLKYCPWCGSPIDPGKNIFVETFDQGVGRTLQYCSDSFGECPFGQRRSKGEGLPIVVVDEEVYRRLPALLIATVDKFAQMPWKGASQMLFGRVTGWCPRHGYRSPDLPDTDSHPKKNAYPACKTVPMPNGLRPPDLIIQDELHLISGPLGTLVGLYETAIDALCQWSLDNQMIRPKVIASTATIRRASYQVQSLFQRQVSIFPPSGLDATDNFFAHQTSETGRLYLGLCASGTRLKSVLIRAYVTAMAAAQTLYERYAGDADAYMTLIGYFNSVRELGGMMRVIDDAVQSRLQHMDQRGLSKRRIYQSTIEELTSRKNAVEIPDILDRLETPFGTKDTEKKPLDVVLATNMISVGVDVGRLGVMIVAGQPKATAEYIQTTSRVGRQKPGVVITVYNWTRPRDLSHYERFEHYHSTFYQQVEALSVTPFAPRALDRALSAIFVSLIRLYTDRLNKDDRAGLLKPTDPAIQETIEWIVDRAYQVTKRPEVAEDVRHMLNTRVEEWLRQTRLPSSQLTYSTKRGSQVKLLTTPQEREGDWKVFTCLNSLRDVEAPIRLILDDYRMDDER